MRSVRHTILCTLLTCLAWPAALAAQWRAEVQGREAAVVAGHPLAAAAGMDVLRRGGNAVDAAVTMAAVLAVVRPHMNGLGGDAFMLIREGRSGRVRALNGSGRSPAAATLASFRARGLDAIPDTGLLTVTVPGALRAWAEALRRHGSIPLADALAPAITLAEGGFAVSEKLAADIAAAAPHMTDEALRAVFLPDGAPPAPGYVLRQPDLARTLQQIARDGVDVFHVGDIGRRIALFMAAENAPLGIEDLADYSPLWQEPIATTYAGFRVLAAPPNSQGAALLLQMNLAELYDLPALGHNSEQYVHTLVELKKLAFAERDRFISDPTFAEIPLDRLISKAFARSLVASFGATPGVEAPIAAARDASWASGGDEGAGDGDTVFLGVVDAQGNAVSLIQSLYSAFGSRRMVPGTGVVLHNRGASFTMDTTHVNVLAPRKRPYHTLSPAIVLRPDNSLFMVIGTPGGDGQTQTQLQVFNNIALFGMSPQRAVEAPRWRSFPDGSLLVEDRFPAAAVELLRASGHPVEVSGVLDARLGGAQVIMLLPSGVRAVGADPRREAFGIAW
jgi:gamma-glutamyltranspeptidase / glutathione hydrolase